MLCGWLVIVRRSPIILQSISHPLPFPHCSSTLYICIYVSCRNDFGQGDGMSGVVGVPDGDSGVREFPM